MTSLTRAWHILYVDDYAPMCELVTESLEDAGYRVTACIDAPAALQALRSPVDAVVIDYNMPALRGDELARQVLQEATLPVLIVSGHVDAEVRARALDAGARAVVHKEDLYDRLPSILAELLEQR